MSLSVRERWMIAAAVPFVVLAFHVSVLREPLDQRLATAEATLATRGPVTDFGPVREVEALRARVAALEAGDADVEQRKRKLLAAWSAPRERAQTIGRVTELLRVQGVRVERSGNVELESAPFDPALSQLTRDLAEFGGSAPAAWRFEARTTFLQLAGALEQLRAFEAFALVVSLDLKRRRDGALDAVLVLWI